MLKHIYILLILNFPLSMQAVTYPKNDIIVLMQLSWTGKSE
jgi:hypothetical protein